VRIGGNEAALYIVRLGPTFTFRKYKLLLFGRRVNHALLLSLLLPFFSLYFSFINVSTMFPNVGMRF
jgi:hypothetical protein